MISGFHSIPSYFVFSTVFYPSHPHQLVPFLTSPNNFLIAMVGYSGNISFCPRWLTCDPWIGAMVIVIWRGDYRFPKPPWLLLWKGRSCHLVIGFLPRDKFRVTPVICNNYKMVPPSWLNGPMTLLGLILIRTRVG